MTHEFMESAETISAGRAWWLAIRPKTLPAAVAPVVLGGAVAYLGYGPAVLGGRLVLCLAVALLLQIAANLANDYFDYANQTDQSDRLGPLRVTQAGLLAPGAVLAACGGCLAVAAALGLVAVWLTGWVVLVVGGLCLVLAVGYSAGPLPLARLGLGELTAFVFFGPVPCVATVYVITGQFNITALWLSILPGAFAAAIMAVNNLRDIETDARAGKRTLAVRLGERRARQVCVLWILIGASVPILGAILLDSLWYLAALAPLCLRGGELILQLLLSPISRSFNACLARTARLELAVTLIMAAVMVLG